MQVKCENCGHDNKGRAQFFHNRTGRISTSKYTYQNTATLHDPSSNRFGLAWQLLCKKTLREPNPEPILIELTLNHRNTEQHPQIAKAYLTTLNRDLCKALASVYIVRLRPGWSAAQNKKVGIQQAQHDRITDDLVQAKLLECVRERSEGGCTLYKLTLAGLEFLAYWR